MAIVAGARAAIDLTVGQWLDSLMAEWLIDVDRSTDWYVALSPEQEKEKLFLETFLWPLNC